MRVSSVVDCPAPRETTYWTAGSVAKNPSSCSCCIDRLSMCWSGVVPAIWGTRRHWNQCRIACVARATPDPAGLQAALATAVPTTPEAAETVRLERGYFRMHADRMDYPTFRARGLPIGSGAVESAAKHVVQTRMKRAGMRWRPPGAEALLTLCAYQAGDRPLTLVPPTTRSAA